MTKDTAANFTSYTSIDIFTLESSNIQMKLRILHAASTSKRNTAKHDCKTAYLV